MLYIIQNNEDNWSLRKWARHHLNLSYPSLNKLIRKKKITIKQHTTALNSILKEGMHLHAPSKISAVTKEIIQSDFLRKITVFENEHIIIIEKPYNIISQGGENSIAVLTNGYIVHRLDKTTTGLMIIAKTKASADFISQQIRNQTFEKKYLALCKGNCEKQGVWENYIDNKEAITEYKKIKYNNNTTLLELTPKTGRKHQLRIHCAQNNIPIIGDDKYGMHEGSRLYLHSYCIKFIDFDTDKLITIKSTKAFES